MTIRLRNPRKLGVAVASWLRQEGLDCECTAATCLYFFWKALRSSLVTSSVPSPVISVAWGAGGCDAAL
jgi:hypothetical protein